MKKNYYDILQVNKNASAEIIEKAYKTLAKMYHPDLQEESNKKQAEEILKQINEAYEILSDSEKKKNYDAFLAKDEDEHLSNKMKNENDKSHVSSTTYNSTISIRDLHALQEQERLYKQKLQQDQFHQKQLQYKRDLAYQEQLQQARKQAYYDAYIQDLKNRGYKIRYKKSIKDYIKGLIGTIIVLFILFLLWKIPFIQNFILSFLEKYTILKK
ncbi:MAG: J domain-containing protein [Clostridia bacterium]|nr:J domain-containing protein [Clostridia bacterium]